jgi:death-on-curing protein
MTEWRWVAWDTILATHDWLIAEHGGLDGIRDAGLVQSALARPQHLHPYGDPDAAALAAAYAYGLTRNHGFMDGNKHIGWVAARLFLADNGRILRFDPLHAILVMEGIAAGLKSEADVGQWFRTRIEVDPGKRDIGADDPD